ncbi:MAG TPA: mechanosensitive ion channel family protein [Vicinamibacterales bacterium]|nr:mechanosensitive ion channel family protein [Vicinamibacterales bacterium]
MGVSTLILAGAATLVVTLGLMAAIRSRFVRGRLAFTAWLLLAFAGLELAATQGWGDVELISALGRLAFVLSIVNLVVVVLVNPWRDHRPSDRFPAIVQDVAVIGVFLVIATILLREQLLATSAVGAVVVGFALQDTLGNFFAGLAIQIEKPFRVGHWISIGGNEGQVQEVTWRATKLRTKDGQFLIVPNSVISKDPILNYSEPTIPTRLEVEVGASYLAPPNDVRAAIHRAIANAALALGDPKPVVIVKGFGGSSIDYAARFWIGDYANDTAAKDQVRTNIWYEFRRANIEIPWPIQIQYTREEQPLRAPDHIDAAARQLSRLDLFSTLSPDACRALAAGAADHLFAAGEAIVRQGAEGSSMFVVLHGRVEVVLEPSNQQVAMIPSGGFFGEMSLLTGDPRTATVRAVSDVQALEIGADNMRSLAQSTPGLLEHISGVVEARRAGLAKAEATAAAAAAAHATSPQSLLARIKAFLAV